MSTPARLVRDAPSIRSLRLSAGALTGERVVVAALALLLAAATAATWRKWGIPEVDAGAELTTADLVANGAVPYRDVRYFYGPLGLYSLAGAFDVFGTSFTTVFAFGVAQAGAILAAFYILARRWVPPLSAALGTAILMAIGFSGTAYNFVLPHTNSATFGLLCVLVELLLLTHRRTWAAGALAGLAALTRPEFALVAAAAAIAYVIGVWRDEDRRAGLGAAGRIVLPALLIPGVVLGLLAASAGAERLLLENLWPADFIRSAGFRTQSYWMPLTASSAIGLLARGAVYCALLAGLLATWSRFMGARGPRRLSAFAPLAVAIGGLALAALLWRLSGVAVPERVQVETEVTKGLLGMSWLPLLGLAAAGWAAVRFARGRPAPLSGSWALDLPLIAVAAGLGLRAYAAFTPERSYAVYYAAPLVLLLALMHHRIATRHPAARVPALACLAAVASALAAYSLVGLYADDTVTVQTARGTYVSDGSAGPATQEAIDAIRARAPAKASILAAPADGGLYFMTGRRPALYEVMLLPGLLYSASDERAAVARLRAVKPALAVVGMRDLSDYGSRRFGRDYNRIVGAYLDLITTGRLRYGNQRDLAAGSNPSRAFEVRTLRR